MLAEPHGQSATPTEADASVGVLSFHARLVRHAAGFVNFPDSLPG